MADIVDIGLSVDSRSVDKGTRSLDRFGDQSKRTESATGKLNGSLNKGAIAFAALAAAAAAALAAASFSIIKAKEFEKSISDLSAITGVTGKDLEYLSAKSKEFGATTTLSASQAAEAFKLIASAKPDLLGNVEALAAVTRETITLAEAAGMELPAAANALGSSLNQFSAGAEEAGRFINVLAAGAKYGSSEIEQTSEALRVAGTVANNAGLSFEETNAAIQAMAAVALKGAEAGTGLRGVILKLSTQARDEFNPEVVGLSQAIKNLADANLTTTEKTKLFGQESITAANALINQADSLGTLTAQLTSTNTAYEQASTRTDNLEGDMKKFYASVDTAAASVGEHFIPVLREVVQFGTEAARVINSIFDSVPDDEKKPTAFAEKYGLLGIVQFGTEAARVINSIFDSVPEDEKKLTALTEKYELLGIAQSKYAEGSKEYAFVTDTLRSVENEIQSIVDEYDKADIERTKKIEDEKERIKSEKNAAEMDRIAQQNWDKEVAEIEHLDKLAQIQYEADERKIAESKRISDMVNSIEREKIAMSFSIAQSLIPLVTKNAKAQALISAGLSAAEVFMNYQVASARALAELGPVAGAPVAAALEGKMIFSMAAIAARAALSLGGGGAGSSPSFSGSVPTTPSVRADQQGFEKPQAPQRDITVNIEPGIYTEQHMRKLAEDLREAYMNGAPRP